MDEAQKLIRKYLKSVKMMQLAVVNDQGPWVTTLYYAIDDELKMYWISLPDTDHSQAIDTGSKVAATVPAVFEFGKPIAGVSMRGSAEHITDLEVNRDLLEFYAEKLNREAEFVENMISDADPHHLYVFRPTYFRLFDRINFDKGSEIREWMR